MTRDFRALVFIRLTSHQTGLLQKVAGKNSPGGGNEVSPL